MDVEVAAWAWLPKADLTPDQIVNLERMLTVYPQKTGDYPGEPPQPILMFKHNGTKFGVPREFFFQNRRAMHNVTLNVTDGSDDWWPAEFVGQLRPEQRSAVEEVVTMFKAGRMGGIMQAKPGWGKCQKIGTPLLKYDGSIVLAEEVRVGDLLMGPDSHPRRVSVVSRGRGPMYKIIPEAGEPWECNDVHILTLVHSLTGEIIDIEIGDYLNRLSPMDRHYLKQFTPERGIDFAPSERLPLDPYFLGVWFGDGTKGTDEIDGTGREVVGDASKLPQSYLTASRADRQSFLAGFIDTDGYNNQGCIQLVQRRRAYADGVAFVARSLGIRATIRPKTMNGQEYWQVNMAGDFSQLPTRVARKTLTLGPRQKKVATRTGFEVQPSGEGEYVGFVLDGDGRYLLGDFTVTHNTVVALAIVAALKRPTLVVVHKEFLMDQWVERIENFLPSARIGRVQQDLCDFRGKTIVMGMVHSLAEHEYPPDFFSWPGLVLTDECFVGTQEVLTPGGAALISEVREGDEVFNATGTGVVTGCGSREVSLRDLVHVLFLEGSEALCTRNHLFLTGRGWVRAEDLCGSDVVLTHCGCTDIMHEHGASSPYASDVRGLWEAGLRKNWEKVLLLRLRGSGEATFEETVRDVWGDAREAGQESLLFSCVRSEMVDTDGRSHSEGDEVSRSEGVAQRESLGSEGSLAADVREESDARSLCSGGSIEKTSGNGARPISEGRERATASGVAAPTSRNARLRMGCGTRGCDSYEKDAGRPSTALQGRHCESGENDSGRGGRQVTQRIVQAGAGSSQDSVPRILRVGCVSRAEPGSLERFGVGYSSPGRVRVYNLAVSGHPSYVLVSGAVVHNCHRIGARTWAPVLPKFRARFRLGFTATPRRKDGADNVFWQHIGPILFAGKEERLKPVIKRVWTNFKLVKTDRFNPNLAPKSLLTRFLCASRHRNDLIVDQLVQAIAAGRKCLVLSERLKHLQDMEDQLRKVWPRGVGEVSTGQYIGGRTKEQLARAAEAKVIFASVQYASEGLDLPALDTLFLTTPMSDVEQAVGRIQRPFSGKKDPIVVDFRDDSISMFEAMAVKRDKFYSKVTA